MTEQGAARWQRLALYLNELGVELSIAPTTEQMRARVLDHLLGLSCTAGPYGFWTREKIQLDSGPSCGVLAGRPTVINIEGHDPMIDARGAYEAGRERCAAAQPVAIQVQEQGTPILAPCQRPMSAADETFEFIGQAPPPRRPRY